MSSQQSNLTDTARPPGTYSSPRWARVWHQDVEGDARPPALAVVAQGRRVVREELRGYRAPIVTGRSYSRLHAPALDGPGVACNSNWHSTEPRVVEHAVFAGHREICDDPRCSSYFDAIEEVTER